MKSINIIFSLIIVIAIVSCDSNESEIQQQDLALVSSNSQSQILSGEQLLNTRCMICHKLAPTHDSLLAAPMRGIQRNYKEKFVTKEEFIKAVVDWASHPDSTNSAMEGAIEQFGVMPNLYFSKEELQEIANYMYDADFPKPAWSGRGSGH